MLMFEVADSLIRQGQCNPPFLLVERSRDAIHHDAQVVEPGQPDVTFGSEAGLGCAVFALLEGAATEHLE